MKNKIFGLVAVLTLVSSVVPQRANAGLIAALAIPEIRHGFSRMNAEYSVGMKVFTYGSLGVFCVFAIPVCVLDERAAQQVPNITPGYLKEQGYSDREALSLTIEQEAVKDALLKSKQTFKVEPQDTRETVAAELRSIYPVSDAYVDVFSFAYGIPKSK